MSVEQPRVSLLQYMEPKRLKVVDRAPRGRYPDVHVATWVVALRVASCDQRQDRRSSLLAARLLQAKVEETAEVAFQPSSTCTGPRPGYKFEAGPQGLGYYRVSRPCDYAVTYQPAETTAPSALLLRNRRWARCHSWGGMCNEAIVYPSLRAVYLTNQKAGSRTLSLIAFI